MFYTLAPVPDQAAVPDPEHEAEVRPLPVLAEPRPIERRAEVSLVGVATFLLVRILRRPRGAASLRLGGGRRGKKVDVAASRSFLVDIHLLKDR
jgi:hypothetical protein